MSFKPIQNSAANVSIANPMTCLPQQKVVSVLINYSIENMLKIHCELFTPQTLYMDIYSTSGGGVSIYEGSHTRWGPLIASEGSRAT